MEVQEPKPSIFSQIDLSNKLIIKAQIGDDIRRIPIHNEDITYDELVLMMQRVFRGKLKNTDEVTIKYKDEDGDLITIFDSTDLSFAIQCSRILKLTLFVNGLPRPLESDQVKHLRKQLAEIRNQVIYLMDTLEPPAAETASQDEGNRKSHPAKQKVVVSNAAGTPQKGQQADSSSSAPAVVVDTAKTAMFDPYKKPEQADSGVMQSFGLDREEERPGSPTGSTASLGSAHGQQMTPSHQPYGQNAQGQSQPQSQPQGQPVQGQQPTSMPQQSQQYPSAPQQGQPGYPQAAQGSYQMPAQAGQPAASQGYGSQQPSAPFNQGFPPQSYAPASQTQQYGGQQQQPQQQQQQQQPTPYPQQQQQQQQQPSYNPQQQGYPPAPAGGPPSAPGGQANPYARNLQYGRPSGYPQQGYK